MHFKTIIWRTGQATGEVGGEVQRVVIVMNGEMKRAEIQHAHDFMRFLFYFACFTEIADIYFV